MDSLAVQVKQLIPTREAVAVALTGAGGNASSAAAAGGGGGARGNDWQTGSTQILRWRWSKLVFGQVLPEAPALMLAAGGSGQAYLVAMLQTVLADGGGGFGGTLTSWLKRRSMVETV